MVGITLFCFKLTSLKGIVNTVGSGSLLWLCVVFLIADCVQYQQTFKLAQNTSMLKMSSKSEHEFINEKSAQRDANTARQKIFAPPQTPFAGAQDRQNLISWRRSLPAPIDPVWWRSMHAISSYRGNRHRPPQTPPVRPPVLPPATDRTDNNTLRRCT